MLFLAIRPVADLLLLPAKVHLHVFAAEGGLLQNIIAITIHCRVPILEPQQIRCSPANGGLDVVVFEFNSNFLAATFFVVILGCCLVRVVATTRITPTQRLRHL